MMKASNLLALLFLSSFMLSPMASLSICEYTGCVCDYYVSKAASCRKVIFEYLPDLPEWLEQLDLSHNHLTALMPDAFHGALKLRKISFTDAQLSFVSPHAFRQLAQLEYLDLSGNNIETLQTHLFRFNDKLKWLNLSRNEISDLSDVVDSLRSTRVRLQHLDMSENPLILSRTAYHFPAVRELRITNIRMQSADKKGIKFHRNNLCPNLLSCRMLEFNDELIETLEWLDLSNTGIAMDEGFLSMVSKVRHLNIAGDRLKRVEDLNTLWNFRNIRHLNISGLHIPHPVTTWDIFPQHLQVLDINDIGLSAIDAEKMRTATNLSVLRASRNKLTRFTMPQTQQLVTLDLSNNQLDNLPVTNTSMGTMRHLDLSHNRLTSLGRDAFKHYPQLESVRLRGNRLQKIHLQVIPQGNPVLLELDLSANQLSSVPAMTLPRLESLNLSGNLLTQVDTQLLKGLMSIRILDLSDNPKALGCSREHAWRVQFSVDCIAWVRSMANKRTLQWLSLARTDLVDLPDSLLRSWPQLQHLDMAGNRITSEVLDRWVSGSSLPPHLRSFNLSRNDLSTVRNGSFAADRWSTLRTLDLSHNPFICDCNLTEMQRIAFPRQRRSSALRSVDDKDQYYCYSPRNHWQYPLEPFLEAVTPCHLPHHPNIPYVMALVLSSLIALALICVICWKCSVFCQHKFVNTGQYFYRPLSMNVPPGECPSPSAV